LRQQTHPSGFPSMSLGSRLLHSVKRQARPLSLSLTPRFSAVCDPHLEASR